MKQVDDNLHVGTVSEAAKVEYNILNLSEQCIETHEDAAYVHFPISEDGSDESEIIKQVIRAGRALRKRGETAVVSDTLSQKAAVIAAAVMSLDNYDLLGSNLEKISYVKSGVDTENNLTREVRQCLLSMGETQDF
jgi:hypothetical protein